MPTGMARIGSKTPFAGSRWRHLSRKGFEIRIASNLRSIEGKTRFTSKVAAEIPTDVLGEISDFQLERAVQYSSGGRTAAELATHRPGIYSTRRPARQDDYIINVQRGVFRAGWRKRPIRRAGTEFTAGVFNVATPVAFYLAFGTRKMRERPILSKINEDSRAVVNRVMTRARMRVRRAWQRGGMGFMERFK
jgi:hypothetical protein